MRVNQPYHRTKKSVARRRFLTTAVTAGTTGISLPEVLRQQAQATDVIPGTKPDTAVINIWLGGGPSQFETYDPKPRAPQEIRGSYGDIATNLAGLRISDTLPLHANIMDKTAVIRSFTIPTNNHIFGAHWCMSGLYETRTESLNHPSIGSLVSKLRGPNRPGVPPYVHFSQPQDRNFNIGEAHYAGYLGVSHNPFTIKADSSKSEFQVDNLKLADAITLERLEDRQWLMKRLDTIRRAVDSQGVMDSVDQFNRLALEMVSGSAARNAFDLSRVDSKTRERYGNHRWGQSALLALRLVEAGVPFVTINTAPDSLCWDWHLNLKHDHRPADGSLGPSRGMDVSGPWLDRMVTALVEDIYDRGLDKKVLLLVWGEFGRTPRINKTGGRDHWGSLMSVLMAGGGLRVGQVIGASNSKGEVPVERPIGPLDILVMVYRHLGMDLNLQTINRAGRPIHLLAGGEIIPELV